MMDNNKYFKIHQKDLLRLVNTESGRFLLSTLIGKVSKHKIDQITPNSFRQDLNEFVFQGKQLRKVYQSTFTSRKPFADLLIPILEKIIIANNEWKPIENRLEAFEHYSGLNPSRNYPQIFLNSSTFNPTTGANDPCDGVALCNIAQPGVSWGTLVGDAGTSGVVTGSTGIMMGQSASTGSGWVEIDRAIYNFATGTLTSAATITAVTLSLYVNSTTNPYGDTPAIQIVNVTPNSHSTIIASDYGQFGSSSYAAINFSSLTTSAYNDFTGASITSQVNKTSDTVYGARSNWDTSGSFGGSYVNAGQVICNINFADAGSNLPKLVVTYTLPSSGGSFLLNFI